MVLMGAIILLHVLWFTMFLRMGYILVFKGEDHDLSEHKKGEQQNGTPHALTSSGKNKLVLHGTVDSMR